ncbi:nucleotidyltransferase family protein [Silicimonas algicola]|uniref:nucleotidyltransferase family protein n=1 Tax=Silicimonas algicola TaxID=1826607 RepID=UPI0013DE84E6|nr:nucleotidyltransferase family protein [Silicimonas algicola]
MHEILALASSNLTISANDGTGFDVEEDFVRALVSDAPDSWPETLNGTRVLERLVFHGTEVLSAAALKEMEGVPAEVLDAVERAALVQGFWEDRHRKVIGDAVDALAEAGIDSVILKGTASAYSVYDMPAARTRGDTDLLIAGENVDRAGRILGDLGFGRDTTFSLGGAVTQFSFSQADASCGWEHVIDLHWSLNNSAVLSRAFSTRELLKRSVPLARFSAMARAPHPVDALLITCLHRFVHLVSPYSVEGVDHFSADRLIWLADIDRLARTLSDKDWGALRIEATRRGLADVTASGLETGQTIFGTPLPEGLIGEWNASPPSLVDRYLKAGRITRTWMDLRALDGAGAKAAFVRDHLFPRADYMHARFGEGGSLSILYLRRVLRGLAKVLRQDLGRP